MMQLSSYVIGCCSNLHPNYNNYSFWFSTSRPIRYSDATPFLLPRTARQPPPPPYAAVTCSAANKPSSSTQVSSTAKIRSEVLSPFRSVRMFFYLAFIASATIGGLIATNQLIAALANSSKAAQVPDILMGLGIDVGAVSIFAFLYSRENNAKNVQLARLSREENLSNLKLSVNKKKVIPVSDLRGIARLVILAGPASFISECFRLSEPYTEGLLERGVLVVPFATDGNSPSFEFEESEEMKEVTRKRKMLWQLVPVYATNWSEWLDEQKKLAKVSPESPVYLSLRMDGRVRGSGVGYPPWNAFVAQLPPVKGMWSGLFDGMDGRVL
ncbi:protein LOW PSII ACCUMULATION 1, chloroplastic isoform X1 [Camellia sinensis]|uniref:protein LOW PSII ACCUMULATION 1, chloroplastic isoform X1 n=2 Tax=Camellia sinensis TaxID=4442 RepID=UPI0010361FC3|nr:protein LOW PSII ACCUMULATION 1, chloroplastic isoform X1 [Camellia sinensis]